MKGFSVKKLKEKLSIGIIGVQMGCGATHLAIALANYLQSGLGRRTALLELSGKNDLKEMMLRVGDKKQKLLGVRYYTGICVGKIPEIMNSRFEAFVLDLGADYTLAREELLRCDRKIVVGSTCPWRSSAYGHFLKNVIATENFEAWEFLSVFANMQDKKNVQKRFGVHLLSVPFIENPFYLKKEDIVFLQNII